MPRTIILADHLSGDQLRQRMAEAADARQRAHYQVVYLKSLDHDAPAIAEATGYSQNWVRTLLHRYNADGEAGLRDRLAWSVPGWWPSRLAPQRGEGQWVSGGGRWPLLLHVEPGAGEGAHHVANVACVRTAVTAPS